MFKKAPKTIKRNSNYKINKTKRPCENYRELFAKAAQSTSLVVRAPTANRPSLATSPSHSARARRVRARRTHRQRRRLRGKIIPFVWRAFSRYYLSYADRLTRDTYVEHWLMCCSVSTLSGRRTGCATPIEFVVIYAKCVRRADGVDEFFRLCVHANRFVNWICVRVRSR